jgi:hypothetical protein
MTLATVNVGAGWHESTRLCIEAAATEGAVLLGGNDLVSALVRRVSGQQTGLGAVLAACALLAIFALHPSSASASANANWETGLQASLPADAGINPGVVLTSVSCPSAGDCTAAGEYVDGSGGGRGLLLTQSAGAWGTGTETPLPANAATAPGSFITDISCPSVGNCSAVGGYQDSSLHGDGLLLTETAGVWTGVEAMLPADANADSNIHISSVSCASPGNCAAVGQYIDTSLAFHGVLFTETAGVWATGVAATLPADARTANAQVSIIRVSCASAGKCSAVGDYVDNSGHSQSLLLAETGGTWATGVKAPLPANMGTNPEAGIDSVSCASAGNCTAVGNYADSSNHFQGVLLTETAGVWATGVEASLPANAATQPSAFVDWVSCGSPGNCTAVGGYTDSSNHFQGVLLTETAGSWAPGVQAPLPANAAANPNVSPNSISCALPGDCSAVGTYTDSSGHTDGLLLTETAGVWAIGEQAPLPADASAGAGAGDPSVAVNSVACPTAGDCAAAGRYIDSSHHSQGLLLSSAPATPTLTASGPASGAPGTQISAASISAALAGGSAPTGTVTFKVFGPQSSPPTSCTSGGTTVGTASVSGNRTYHPSGGFAPASPGQYWWFAGYGGDRSDNAVASACGAGMAPTDVATAAAAPPQPPTLSAVKLGSKRFRAKKGTTLKATLSQAAKVKVAITRAVKGRRVRNRCKRNAKKGKRCTTTITKRTLSFSGKAKPNVFNLKLRGLAKGAYTAAVTAKNANGTSETVKLKFTIKHR